MCQAGRHLPEYRRLWGEGSILEAVRQPDLAAERTLQPVRRYGVDAAVLFLDISPVPLTGFAGGPFTLASYLVEGAPSLARLVDFVHSRTGNSGAGQ
jgi:uroporphyrinogen-III decarboxylase